MSPRLSSRRDAVLREMGIARSGACAREGGGLEADDADVKAEPASTETDATASPGSRCRVRRILPSRTAPAPDRDRAIFVPSRPAPCRAPQPADASTPAAVRRGACGAGSAAAPASPRLEWDALGRDPRLQGLWAVRAPQAGRAGVGDRQARWMLVGEAPGAEEDQRGEPFVGQAGACSTTCSRRSG